MASRVTINTETLGIAWVAGQQFRIALQEDFVREVGNTENPNPANANLITFTTNATGPTIATTTPADNTTAATGIVNARLSIFFVRNIKAGSGNVQVYQSGSPDVLLLNVPTSDPLISFVDNELRITVTGLMRANTSYYVRVDNGAITDRDGFAFTGINNATTFNFTTAASTNVLFRDLSANITGAFSPQMIIGVIKKFTANITTSTFNTVFTVRKIARPLNNLLQNFATMNILPRFDWRSMRSNATVTCSITTQVRRIRRASSVFTAQVTVPNLVVKRYGSVGNRFSLVTTTDYDPVLGRPGIVITANKNDNTFIINPNFIGRSVFAGNSFNDLMADVNTYAIYIPQIGTIGNINNNSNGVPYIEVSIKPNHPAFNLITNLSTITLTINADVSQGAATDNNTFITRFHLDPDTGKLLITGPSHTDLIDLVEMAKTQLGISSNTFRTQVETFLGIGGLAQNFYDVNVQSFLHLATQALNSYPYVKGNRILSVRDNPTNGNVDWVVKTIGAGLSLTTIAQGTIVRTAGYVKPFRGPDSFGVLISNTRIFIRYIEHSGASGSVQEKVVDYIINIESNEIEKQSNVHQLTIDSDNHNILFRTILPAVYSSGPAISGLHSDNDAIYYGSGATSALVPTMSVNRTHTALVRSGGAVTPIDVPGRTYTSDGVIHQGQITMVSNFVIYAQTPEQGASLFFGNATMSTTANVIFASNFVNASVSVSVFAKQTMVKGVASITAVFSIGNLGGIEEAQILGQFSTSFSNVEPNFAYYYYPDLSYSEANMLLGIVDDTPQNFSGRFNFKYELNQPVVILYPGIFGWGTGVGLQNQAPMATIDVSPINGRSPYWDGFTPANQIDPYWLTYPPRNLAPARIPVDFQQTQGTGAVFRQNWSFLDSSNNGATYRYGLTNLQIINPGNFYKQGDIITIAIHRTAGSYLTQYSFITLRVSKVSIS